MAQEENMSPQEEHRGTDAMAGMREGAATRSSAARQARGDARDPNVDSILRIPVVMQVVLEVPRPHGHEVLDLLGAAMSPERDIVDASRQREAGMRAKKGVPAAQSIRPRADVIEDFTRGQPRRGV